MEDPNLFPMLEQFRLAGKKVFLLTNSYYDYTDTVMTFLLASHIAATEGRSHSEATREGYAWAKRFDVVSAGGVASQSQVFFLRGSPVCAPRIGKDSKLSWGCSV